MRKALLVVALGLVLLLGVVACSSASSTGAAGSTGTTGGSGDSGGQPISTTMTDFQFSPNTWTVKAGQPVTMSAKNASEMLHDWTVKGMESQTKVEAQPGQTATRTFTISTPGTYQVYCSVPGHEDAGMKGTLTVQ